MKQALPPVRQRLSIMNDTMKKSKNDAEGKVRHPFQAQKMLIITLLSTLFFCLNRNNQFFFFSNF